jgi:phosphoglycerate dehydrogenase-like enzyme
LEPEPNRGQGRSTRVERVEKDDLFQQADVLSIHVRLSERTRHLVGERELKLMKPTAYLINTSRGPIVSEPALIAALQSGKTKGAALDVFDKEPLPLAHPFRFLPNVLTTPQHRIRNRGYLCECISADCRKHRCLARWKAAARNWVRSEKQILALR